MENNLFYQDNLSETEKEIVEIQNKIIKNHAINFLGIKPYLISRDKYGHIIILTNNFSQHNKMGLNKLTAYMLGIDNQTGEITPYQVAYCQYRFIKHHKFTAFERDKLPFNRIIVTVLSSHRAFNNLGLGQLLLLATENIALKHNIDTVSLKSTKLFDSILSTPEHSAPICFDEPEKLYDRNHFFYASHGYVEDDNVLKDELILESIKPLKKSPLKKINLRYGLPRSLTLVDKNMEMFSLKNERKYFQKMKENFVKDDYFPTELNNFPSENFCPITLDLSVDSLLDLFGFLRAYPSKPICISPKLTLEYMLFEFEENNENNFEFGTTIPVADLLDEIYLNLQSQYPNKIFNNFLDDFDYTLNNIIKKFGNISSECTPINANLEKIT